MDNLNRSVLDVEQQQEIPTGYGQVTGLSDDALFALRVAERMSFISSGILTDLEKGASPERLKDMFTKLHSNLVSLSSCANRALYKHGFYIQD